MVQRLLMCLALFPFSFLSKASAKTILPAKTAPGTKTASGSRSLSSKKNDPQGSVVSLELCLDEEERKRGIEAGLLHAMARVESGGRRGFSVNAAGRSHHFKTMGEAVDFVRQKQQQGILNISVGTMQLHVPSHRRHFPSLEAMLDPTQNIRYAATLLHRLKKKTGSWHRAVAFYHSSDVRTGDRYKDRVLGAWAKLRQRKNPAL